MRVLRITRSKRSGMSQTTPRRRFLAGAVATALGALGGCASLGDRQQTEETRAFDVGDADDLTVQNGVGDVTVGAEDRDDVRVRAIKRAGSEDQFDAITLNDRRSDGTLALTVENEIDSVLLGSPPSMELEIDVPADLRVSRVETDTGEIDAALAASLDARVVVNCDTGEVTASGLDFSNLETGEHRLEGTLGDGARELSVETNTGDVALTALD